MEDNSATITVANAGYSHKLRHMPRHQKVNVGSIKEEIEKPNVFMPHCPTDKQAADIFTKGLPPAKWPAALQLLNIEQTKPKDKNESPYEVKPIANTTTATVGRVQSCPPTRQSSAGIPPSSSSRGSFSLSSTCSQKNARNL